MGTTGSDAEVMPLPVVLAAALKPLLSARSSVEFSVLPPQAVSARAITRAGICKKLFMILQV